MAYARLSTVPFFCFIFLLSCKSCSLPAAFACEPCTPYVHGFFGSTLVRAPHLLFPTLSFFGSYCVLLEVPYPLCSRAVFYLRDHFGALPGRKIAKTSLSGPSLVLWPRPRGAVDLLIGVCRRYNTCTKLHTQT